MAHCEFSAVRGAVPTPQLPGLPDLFRTHCLVINRGSLANPGSASQ